MTYWEVEGRLCGALEAGWGTLEGVSVGRAIPETHNCKGNQMRACFPEGREEHEMAECECLSG
ncbi:hypothetical protein E2C01_083754 [Portunus trituberculatus]|uniref:Uncharacterized protein n=1 Tax=Portunus trituberculatus TaxID=210409 RepID=A0A5B7J320_PORTR|nr:hypothetical protein [Portunus trituberculatus]